MCTKRKEKKTRDVQRICAAGVKEKGRGVAGRMIKQREKWPLYSLTKQKQKTVARCVAVGGGGEEASTVVNTVKKVKKSKI